MQLSERYSRVAVILHWLVAVLMIGNVILAWSVDYLPDERIRLAIDTHKSIGITVLGLALLRVLWRLGHRPPTWPAGALTPMESRVSGWVHLGLYALMVLLPLSGWLHDSAWKAAATHPMTLFGVVPWPRFGFIMDLDPARKEMLHDLFGEGHELLGYALYGLLGLHIAGALKHQWLDRQKALQRMWF